MSKCKSCGAEIIWIKTANGKSMPCDPEAHFVSERSDGNETFVMRDGRVVKGFRAYGDATSPVGYISHFATCPSADRHRRKSCGNRD